MRPDDQIEILELVLSGPMGQRAGAITALKQAGVSDEQFVQADHGFAREDCQPDETWLAFRVDAPDADAQAHHLAKVAGIERHGWRLRLHRHYLPRAQRPSQPDPFAELEVLKARLAALEQGRPYVPPIAGGAQESPAYVISAAEHSAYLFRQASQSFLSGTGVIGSGDYLVTQNSPAAMNVLVAPGTAWIPGTILAGSGFGSNAGAQSSIGNTNGGSSTSTGFPTTFTEQGPYFGYNDGQVTLGIASANPTNPRIDLPVLTVMDAEYAGSANQVVLQVVTGTAGATPAPPTVPQNTLVLSSVWVPAAASTITSGDLNDLRPHRNSGLFSARPSSGSYAGQTYYATDTGLWYFYNGSSWQPIGTPGLSYVQMTTSGSLQNGQAALASTGITVTLPTPAAGASCAVIANESVVGSSPVTVSGGSSLIFGPGMTTGATSFGLGQPLAAVELLGDGTQWLMVSGQQDTGWIALTPATNWNAFVSGYYPAGYRKAGNTTRIRGAVQNETGSTQTGPVSILSGCPFPSESILVVASGAYSPGSGFSPILEIAGGSIEVYAGTVSNAGVLSLEGLSFDLS